MSDTPVVFPSTGVIQSYLVPITGVYVLEAAGAQGGIGSGAGGKGARMRGTFELVAGEVLQIVVGLQGKPGSLLYKPAGGGGGGSFVWKGDKPLPLPPQPLLVAGGGGGGPGNDAVITMDADGGMGLGGLCGYGGSTDYVNFHYSGGGGTGWRSNGAMGSSPTYCNGGTRWTGGLGADYCGHRGGTGGFGGGGGGSYNGGIYQHNAPGIQTGDGYVSLLLVAAASDLRTPEMNPDSVAWWSGNAALPKTKPSKEPGSKSATMLRCG